MTLDEARTTMKKVSEGKQAEKALKKDDLEAIELINQDEELRSANIKFSLRDGKLWVASLDSFISIVEIEEPEVNGNIIKPNFQTKGDERV